MGDYTRRLAIEIIKQGHKASIVAINDQYCNLPKSGLQNENECTVEVYRIPQSFSNKKRFQLIHTWIKDKKPDWFSLQFVLYAFHAKGLPFYLGENLKRFNNGVKWHIMFHEIWIGLEANEKHKNQLIGGFQKRIIKRLLKQLSPKILHTQLELYKRELSYLGYKSKLLNLPSNIPFTTKKAIKKKTDSLSLVVFGSIYPGAPINEFAKDISFYKKSTGKNVNITLIGRNGNEQKNWIDTLNLYNIPVTVLGEQSSTSISNTLHNSTIGIITTPLYLLEKSGTAAAMRLHNLPIIIVSKEWKPKRNFNLEIPEDVLIFKSNNFGDYIKLKDKNYNKHSINTIASTFLKSLSE